MIPHRSDSPVCEINSYQSLILLWPTKVAMCPMCPLCRAPGGLRGPQYLDYAVAPHGNLFLS